jgi:diguanylate cyclase (GGDEF)-like protein
LHLRSCALAAAFERVGQPAALLLLDLDHFKQTNDTHGHGIGDELLRRAAESIRMTCRPYDIPCRFGGDEFAVVYAQTDGSAAVRAAQRILEAIHRVEVPAAGGTLRASVSAGLCCTTHFSEPFDPDKLFAAADARLYEAKSRSRRLVEILARRASPERRRGSHRARRFRAAQPAPGGSRASQLGCRAFGRRRGIGPASLCGEGGSV